VSNVSSPPPKLCDAICFICLFFLKSKPPYIILIAGANNGIFTGFAAEDVVSVNKDHSPVPAVPLNPVTLKTVGAKKFIVYVPS